MMYEYKCIAIGQMESCDELNNHYSQGWEFVNATASRPGSGIDYVYFTIRRKICVA